MITHDNLYIYLEAKANSCILYMNKNQYNEITVVHGHILFSYQVWHRAIHDHRGSGLHCRQMRWTRNKVKGNEVSNVDMGEYTMSDIFDDRQCLYRLFKLFTVIWRFI